MASPRSTRITRALALSLGSAAVAALMPLGLAAPAQASSAPICSSSSHKALAAKLSKDIRAAMTGRHDTIAVDVWDANTGVYCAVNASAHFDSASVVKATIMGAVLRRAQDQHRGLTSWESSNLHAMITQSDNTAASNLWGSLGRARFSAFLRMTGMTSTVPGPGGYWGLTQITARDEMKLLDHFTDDHSVLSAHWRAYALNLMSEVTPSQRWGTPYGTPSGVTAHNKNGWLPRATHGWRVHSIGVFTGKGKDYRMTVLTDDNATMGYGITTIERIALAVHRDIGGSTTRSALAPQVTGPATETGDGSAPYGQVG
ncbi:serine hydrolase [Streptacidiphilus sp. EB129]|uniref:serine hydrolase n=1 Tax=Streptacidiphilus sp. EB129 TaxID=3156262 RepID=UPI0035196B66